MHREHTWPVTPVDSWINSELNFFHRDRETEMEKDIGQEVAKTLPGGIYSR